MRDFIILVGVVGLGVWVFTRKHTQPVTAIAPAPAAQPHPSLPIVGDTAGDMNFYAGGVTFNDRGPYTNVAYLADFSNGLGPNGLNNPYITEFAPYLAARENPTAPGAEWTLWG